MTLAPAFALAFAVNAPACKLSKKSTWSLDKAQFTHKAKTIYVMRVIARIAGRENTAYRIEIVRALKGARVEQMSFDLVPPKPKFPKEEFAFSIGPDCKPRGNLVTEQLYIFYPGTLENLNAVVPLTTMNDPLIDQLDAIIAAEKSKLKD